MARYAPSGHLVFARGGSLFAVAFDPRALSLRGSPVKVVDGVATDVGSGAVQFAISEGGALLWTPGGSSASYELVWVDRQGAETKTPARPRALQRGRALAGRHARGARRRPGRRLRPVGRRPPARRRHPADVRRVGHATRLQPRRLPDRLRHTATGRARKPRADRLEAGRRQPARRGPGRRRAQPRAECLHPRRPHARLRRPTAERPGAGRVHAAAHAAAQAAASRRGAVHEGPGGRVARRPLARVRLQRERPARRLRASVPVGRRPLPDLGRQAAPSRAGATTAASCSTGRATS